MVFSHSVSFLFVGKLVTVSVYLGFVAVFRLGSDDLLRLFGSRTVQRNVDIFFCLQQVQNLLIPVTADKRQNVSTSDLNSSGHQLSPPFNSKLLLMFGSVDVISRVSDEESSEITLNFLKVDLN